MKQCNHEIMEIKAQAKYIRTSAKKIRLVLDIIKGADVVSAENYLHFINKKAAGPVLKLLQSAVANARHNFNLKKTDLYIKKIVADEGPTLHRWRPRAFGRATPVRKRSSHLTIILEPKTEKAGKKVAAKGRKAKIAKPTKIESLPKKEPAVAKREKGMPAYWQEKLKAKEKVVEEGARPEIFDKTRKGKDRFKQHLDKVGLKKAGGAMKRIFRRKSV